MVPPTLHALIAARIDRLSPSARDLIADTAVLGGIAMLSFHHVLTQELAYGTLLQAHRKTRHGRAAETIESLYRGRTEEVCDQLAHHWVRSDRAIEALPYY